MAWEYTPETGTLALCRCACQIHVHAGCWKAAFATAIDDGAPFDMIADDRQIQ
jgi:hypothetical protein